MKRGAALAKERGRGIYLLPNIMTSASLFSGFYAIIAAIKLNLEQAAVAVIIAAVFDGLDGRIARMTNTTSRFGVEYDSLADLVSFGVAPAVVAYQWALQGYGRLGWLAAFLYCASTALRLARFNTLAHTSKRYFLGLACPAAAGTVATMVLFCSQFSIEGQASRVAAMALVYGLAFLMVSTVRYYSFKDVPWLQRHPFSAMVLFLLLLSIIASAPRIVLFVLGISYAASGPVLVSWQLLSRIWRGRRASAEREV